MIHSFQEKLLFLYKYSLAPKEIGSVTPSSRFLAKKMLEPIFWNRVSYVAELGAGTGAITKYIDAVKQDETKVLLFEKDTYLRDRLASSFPGYSCYPDAGHLQLALQKEGIDRLDCIVSGLPFFNFPQQIRDQLLDQIASSLKPGGLFVAFQYSLQMRNQLSQRFDIEHIHFVPLNIPPAFVYVCRNSRDIHSQIR